MKEKVWDLKAWVTNWKELGPALQEQRDADVRNGDTAQNIEQLDWSYRYIKSHYPPSNTSGLVDFYQILMNKRS